MIDVQKVKQFNDELKAYRDKAAKNQAEIEFNNREIKRICDELTAELGIQVTPENIAEIAKERKEKLENTLREGEAILARIKQEEAVERASENETVAVQQSMGDQQVMGVQPNVVQTGAVNTQQMYQQYQQIPSYTPQAEQADYQVDQFTQAQPAYEPEFQSRQVAVNTQAQQVQQPGYQDMPQMAPLGGLPNMSVFPTFQVGKKPEQTAQPKPTQEIGMPNLFGSGSGTLQI